MNPCIVIPTYNESEKLATLIATIHYFDEKYAIIIVDDNSPDGTGDIADRLSEKYQKIHVIHRPGKLGVGGAILDGFRLALEEKYDPIITMDADLSHSPLYLKKFLSFSKYYDLVIGSRYFRGIRIDGWRFRKLLQSKLANMFISYVMVKPIWDFTTGYRSYSASFLKKLNLNVIPAEGYLFQIHMIYLAFLLKKNVKEIPIIFKDIENPESKISSRDRWVTFRKIFSYHAPFSEMFRHITYIKKDYRRFVDEYEELLNPPQPKNAGIFSIPEKFTVSIGVMAYNEELNIKKCLNALLNQELISGEIVELTVVSSGSTDRTNEIVEKYSLQDTRVKLIVERQRQGKASAINKFLKYAKGDIAIIESADTITEPMTVEHMIRPFFDPKVGITGAHPLPVNKGNGFITFAVQKLWQLHHMMALDNPKCGEMIAFRNIVPRIPTYTAVDEATIEALFNELGLEKRYAPEAIVKNKGPETFRDFIKQRRRIAAGHKHLKAIKGHAVSTMKAGNILKYVGKDLDFRPKYLVFMFLLICTELFARILGHLDFYFRDKNPYIWDISKSTKHIDEQKILKDQIQTKPDSRISTV
ncbi:MAG: glycosyltransferase [Calditrichaceae bacterium]